MRDLTSKMAARFLSAFSLATSCQVIVTCILTNSSTGSVDTRQDRLVLKGQESPTLEQELGSWPSLFDSSRECHENQNKRNVIQSTSSSIQSSRIQYSINKGDGVRDKCVDQTTDSNFQSGHTDGLSRSGTLTQNGAFSKKAVNGRKLKGSKSQRKKMKKKKSRLALKKMKVR